MIIEIENSILFQLPFDNSKILQTYLEPIMLTSFNYIPGEVESISLIKEVLDTTDIQATFEKRDNFNSNMVYLTQDTIIDNLHHGNPMEIKLELS